MSPEPSFSEARLPSALTRIERSRAQQIWQSDAQTCRHCLSYATPRAVGARLERDLRRHRGFRFGQCLKGKIFNSLPLWSLPPRHQSPTWRPVAYRPRQIMSYQPAARASHFLARRSAAASWLPDRLSAHSCRPARCRATAALSPRRRPASSKWSEQHRGSRDTNAKLAVLDLPTK